MIKLNRPIQILIGDKTYTDVRVISSLDDSILVELKHADRFYVHRFHWDGTNYYKDRVARLQNTPVVFKKYVRWFDHKGAICASVYPTRECIIEQDKANVLLGKTLRIEEISQSF